MNVPNSDIAADSSREQVKACAAEVRASGEWVSFDYRVKEHIAEQLLGLKPGTLKKRRSRAKGKNLKLQLPIPYYNGRAVSYFIVECLPQQFDVAA